MMTLFHNENSLKRGKHQEMWLHFYIEDNIGVSIIDSIPHCHTENALKKGQKQEMCLRFYIEEKKMEYLSSIVFHIVILKML